MKVTRVLSVIFAVLTICGAIYVFYTGGKANAGYAVIPMIFSLIFSQWTRVMKRQKK
jgi:1,4-dihydroxy-2-naphthoate octaprenyltransferase